LYFPKLLILWTLASPDLLEAAPTPIVDSGVQSPPATEAVPETPPPGDSPQEAREQRRGWNDRRRTVRSYARNLGYNSVRVFSKPNWIPLLAGSGLTAASATLDDETVDFFERNPMTDFGSIGATVGGTGAVAAFAIGLFSAGRIAPGDRFRSASYDASQSILINTVYTFALKSATHRQRPDGSNDRSFPSGHASVAFSWATALAKHYGLKVEIPAYTFASLIAISRLANHSHYLSDIVAGATLGHLVGRTVVRGNSRPAEGAPARPVVPDLPGPSVQIVPAFGPDGGSGLAIAISF
jgi:membrane-associated phospholipid phosphatase